MIEEDSARDMPQLESAPTGMVIDQIMPHIENEPSRRRWSILQLHCINQ